MSTSLLNGSQQHHAMYHGGDVQKKAKAAMRRTATHLDAVAADIGRIPVADLTSDDARLLTEAARLMRMLAALKAAPADTIADQIALIVLGTFEFERRRLPFECAKWGTRAELQTMLTQALDSIVWNGARSDQKPADYIAAQLATLPDLKATHAELIRQIEHLAKVEADVRERAAA